MLPHNLILEPCLCSFLEEHADLQGVKLLNILLEQERPVHCIRLCQLADIYPRRILPYGSNLVRFEPIPMTDRQTLADLNRELNRTIRLIALREGQNLPSEDLKEKLEKLTAYRIECSFPNGRIKRFNPEEKRAYDAVSLAFRRLKGIAFRVNKEAFNALSKHLKIGYYVCWKE